MNNRLQKNRWRWRALFALLLPFAALSNATATTVDCVGQELSAVVCSSQRTVVGSDFSIFSFEIQTAGEYEISLSDLMWPSGTLASLSLLLTTSTETVLELTTAGSMMFFASAGTYFAQISAATSMSDPIGLYGLRVENVAPIPLPSTVLLLLSGLITLVYAVRRRVESAGDGPELVPAIA